MKNELYLLKDEIERLLKYENRQIEFYKDFPYLAQVVETNILAKYTHSWVVLREVYEYLLELIEKRYK